MGVLIGGFSEDILNKRLQSDVGLVSLPTNIKNHATNKLI